MALFARIRSMATARCCLRPHASAWRKWFSTLAEDTSVHRLVDHAKPRWRIGHDYKELKQEVGLGDFEGRGWRVSTITPRCRSRFMDSRSLRGDPFPPQQQLPKFSSCNLPFPKVTDPEAPPLRPERHVPNSIVTLCRRLIVKLVAIVSRCRCCTAQNTARSRRNL
jgi:hypothetical protein